jgi:TonB family protein
MKPALTLSFLLVALFCSAQREVVYLLKNNGEYVKNGDSADFVRVVRQPDSASTLYNVLEFYKNGKTKSAGKSSSIDPPIYEGQRLDFYQSGNRKILANYKKGIKVGLEYDFYKNGRPYIVKEYPNDRKIDSSFKDNYLIKNNYDSLGTVLVENGNGYFKAIDTAFDDVSEEGHVKDGKKDGQWKGSSKKPEITFTETYQNGVLINGIAVDNAGKSATYTLSRESTPQFKGGARAFYRYLTQAFYYPETERESNTHGKVVVGFMIDKNGKVQDVRITNSLSPAIDQEVMRIIRNSPQWLPGTMFGSPVKVSYYVPFNVSFD